MSNLRMTLSGAALGIRIVAHLVHWATIHIFIELRGLATAESGAKAVGAARGPCFQGVGMKDGYSIKPWKSDKDTKCKRKGFIH